MKRRLIFLAIALLSIPPLSAQQGLDKFEVQVDGLGCPFCAYGLEKKFKEFEGIKQVKIDIETGNFTFAYPSEKNLSLEAVEKKVQKAGYTPIAGSVTRANGQIEAMHKTVQSNTASSALKNATTRVAGNCEMCKARIEKAALDQAGVRSAVWDVKSKMLKVEFDENTTSREAIEKAIAKAGHDTQHHRAHDDAYENLPGCCHYERINPDKNLK